MLHISLAAEKIFSLWGFPISNSLLTTWIVMGLLIVFAVLSTRKLSIIPSNLQQIAELLVGGLHDFFGSIAGNKINLFFPLIATLFIYILLGNWVGLLPGVGTIGFYESHTTESTTAGLPADSQETNALSETISDPVTDETHDTQVTDTTTSEASMVAEEESHGESEEELTFVPLLRASTADLNTTLALALVSVFAMQYFGIVTLGMHYFKRYINFSDPINFSVGLLEIISDISKIISFAFRLFGNIFAGEVLLAVMAFLMPFIVPLPFLMMELFVGVIQALVFSMLSTAFFMVAIAHE